MTTLPLLSVIVCTYRRERLLGACLDGLAVQETAGLSGVEVVVVDNCPAGSARPAVDAPRPVAPGLRLRYVNEPRTNVAHARNTGLGLARGDFIAFIDDDNRPPPDWARTIVGAALARDAAIVLAPIVPLIEDGSAAQALGRWFRRDVAALADGTVAWRGDGYIPGSRTCNVLVRRDVALSCGVAPFDPVFGRSGGEDIDYFIRIGRGRPRVVACPEALIHEVIPADRATPAHVLRREYQGGHNYARVLLKNRPSKVATVADISLRACAKLALCGAPLLVFGLLRRPAPLSLRVGVNQSLGKLAWTAAPGSWWRPEEAESPASPAVPAAPAAPADRTLAPPN